MIQRANSLAVAAFVLLCIVIGGSGQNSWTNLGLQLTGIALIAWAAVSPRTQQEAGARSLDFLILAGLVTIVAQLIPLSPGLWSELPGREPINDGLRQIGDEILALPVSFTPYQSVAALFAAIPAIAMFMGARYLSASPRLLASAAVTGMVLAVIIGSVQVASGPGSWAYFYEFTNEGAVGFFANRNHMATLLLVSVPLIAALMASAKSDRSSSTVGGYGIGIALLFLIVIGIALNGSLAVLALIIPVAVASASLLPAGARWRWLALPVTGAALLAGVAVLVFNPVASTAAQFGAARSVTGRTAIWSTTVKAIEDSFPVGTGLGSFEQVYRLYEDPASVTGYYVNHAHNDYLELVLELGLPGLLLILLFLAWWVRAAVAIWTSPISTPFQRAATIATAAILAHSVVDFPLRTAAISAIFAGLVAIMAQHFAATPVQRSGDRRPARHVRLG